MRMRYAAIAAILTLCVSSCSDFDGGASMIRGEALRADLEVVARARVLFGHQSVGRDILAGLETLAREAGVDLRIVELDGAPGDGPGVFHAHVGSNGDPASKCDDFAGLLLDPDQAAYDLAMLKFCYVDLGRGTPLEARAMLERYERLVRLLHERRADVTIVHATLPLRSDPPGKKAFLKRLLGRDTDEDADNILRNTFNDLLRERFAGEPLFDVARVESTLPDGDRSFFERDGRTYYTLARAYTDDGGHLNEAGRRRAAAELVRTLSAALARRNVS